MKSEEMVVRMLVYSQSVKPGLVIGNQSRVGEYSLEGLSPQLARFDTISRYLKSELSEIVGFPTGVA
jgi:hypothetical protein